MPDGTSGPVTADKIFSFDDVRHSATVFDMGNHACLILRKTFEFGLPEDVLSATLDILVHELLIFALLQNQHVRVTAQTLADVGQTNLADNLAAFEHAYLPGNRALLDSFLCQSELFVDFQCAGVDAEGFRVWCHALGFIDDYEIKIVSD